MELVFATNNSNKIAEIKAMLSSDIVVLSLQDIHCYQHLREDGLKLEDNALQKARFIYNTFNKDCFADDTGLEIMLLNGEPGVYSARYAGNHCSSVDNINKVLLNLQNIDDRRAVFRTIIALIIDGDEFLFEGKCSGVISKKRMGKNGFGYDSIFIPDNSILTFAEMTQNEKSEISHRGKAVLKFINFLNNSL